MLVTTSHKKHKSHYKMPAVFLSVVFALVFLHGYAHGLTANYLSSISTPNVTPARIAMDNSGMLYVAAPQAGKIMKFASDGSPAGSINGFVRPVSVAVDSANKIYVGDSYDGSVSVITAEGKPTAPRGNNKANDNPNVGKSFSLGKGQGEFRLPGSIAVASNGSIYVTDSFQNNVKVYLPNGTFSFSFGGYGTNPGQMIFPTGIAADNANQEIYLADHNNARVEVFDFNGVFKRTFGSYGSGQGMLTRPQGISVVNGNVYVSDAYQSNIEVFDRNGNFITFIGQYGNGQGEMKVPLDVIQRGTKLFVSNSENGKIDVFGVLDTQGLRISPSELSFVTSMSGNPAGQTVQITPTVPGSQVTWTASVTSSPFPISLSQTSGTTPSTVTVNVSATGLSYGSYKGTVTFSANGIDYPCVVNLTILPNQQQPELIVTPPSLAMNYPKDGLITKSLLVTSMGGGLQWTATTNVQWLTLSPASGSAPSTLSVSLNDRVKNLGTGTYTAAVTVTAPNALGSPVTVTVTLNVSAGTMIAVNTNLENASFTISGPAQYTGTGKNWKQEGVPSGAYSIQFDTVKGFRKPAIRTFKVEEGKPSTVDAPYRELPVANAIVAAKGPDPKNDSFVRIFDLKGNIMNEFKALDTLYGARVAVGDIDGDGSHEIVVAPGPGLENKASIKVFRYDGLLVASTPPLEGTRYGANIAAGDVFGDGKSQIAVSMISGYNADGRTKAITKTVVIYELDDNRNLVEMAQITVQASGSTSETLPAQVAFGDVNGDGKLELMVLNGGALTLYTFDEELSASVAATAPVMSSVATVSAGDINGEGIDEILLGYNDGFASSIQTLKGDLTNPGTLMKAFEQGRSAPTLSSMDWNGDGVAEILAGNGPQQINDAVIRVYSSNGTLLKEIRAFDNSYYGVNAVFGVINASGSAKR
jgi:hypothetical protein